MQMLALRRDGAGAENAKVRTGGVDGLSAAMPSHVMCELFISFGIKGAFATYTFASPAPEYGTATILLSIFTAPSR